MLQSSDRPNKINLVCIKLMPYLSLIAVLTNKHKKQKKIVTGSYLARKPNQPADFSLRNFYSILDFGRVCKQTSIKLL